MGGKKTFELMLEVGHKSKPLSKKLDNGYTHKWTVFVRGINNSRIEHCIQRVVFQLHESFDSPHRTISEPPYEVRETGYAGFEIPIQIYFKNKDRPNHLVFVHDLCLLTNKPNKGLKTERIKFINPNKEFEKCLVKSGAQLFKEDRNDPPPAKKQKVSSLIPSKDMSKQTQSQQQQQQQQNQQRHRHQHHHQQQQQQQQQKQQQQKQQQESNQQPSQNNHHHQQQQQQPQTQPGQKPKTSSRAFIDLFGAPLVYNPNSKHPHKHHHKHSKYDISKEEPPAPTPPPPPPPPVKQEPPPVAIVAPVATPAPIPAATPVVPAIVTTKEDQYANDLQTIQTKISCLSDCDRLQRIVDIVEEAGEWFNLTSKKFEFDLKRLDKKTLSKIERCLQH